MRVETEREGEKERELLRHSDKSSEDTHTAGEDKKKKKTLKMTQAAKKNPVIAWGIV